MVLLGQVKSEELVSVQFLDRLVLQILHGHTVVTIVNHLAMGEERRSERGPGRGGGGEGGRKRWSERGWKGGRRGRDGMRVEGPQERERNDRVINQERYRRKCTRTKKK